MSGDNQYQAPDAWAGEAAARWLAWEAALDRALDPFGRAALARACPTSGERVVDVGCGTGTTVAALADAVGPSGQVLGVDISGPLLGRARERVQSRPQVELREADAQTLPLARDRDLVFSRFGVMFFADPLAAFRNLAGCLRPGGRMTFVCWRGFGQNPWQSVAFSALREVMPAAEPPPAEGPGPHALADPVRLRQVIGAAGLIDLVAEPLEQRVALGPDLARAVEFAMNTGPAGRALARADAEIRRRARDRIALALAPAAAPDGVWLRASAWLVHARSDTVAC